MSEPVYNHKIGDPSEKLRTLRITSLDEEEDEGDAPVNDSFEEEEEDDDDDEDEVEGHEPVSLGFVERPKYSWSLSRELFPSIAGGTPVC